MSKRIRFVKGHTCSLTGGKAETYKQGDEGVTDDDFAKNLVERGIAEITAEQPAPKEAKHSDEVNVKALKDGRFSTDGGNVVNAKAGDIIAVRREIAKAMVEQKTGEIVGETAAQEQPPADDAGGEGDEGETKGEGESGEGDTTEGDAGGELNAEAKHNIIPIDQCRSGAAERLPVFPQMQYVQAAGIASVFNDQVTEGLTTEYKNGAWVGRRENDVVIAPNKTEMEKLGGVKSAG